MGDHAAHLAEPACRALAAQGGPDLSGEAPAGDDAAALEDGRILFAQACRFFHAAQRLDDLPAPRGPEIAFAGRSNVGKSSLINALTGRNGLARASNTPGRTRQLNFFDLGGRLVIVDMPGYGYAAAGHAIKRDWQGLMLDYLRGRPNLARVVLLLDARVPLKESDRTVMELLDQAAVTFQLAITKTDDVKAGALEAKRAEVDALARRHPAAYPLVSATSSGSGEGLAALRASLASLALPRPESGHRSNREDRSGMEDEAPADPSPPPSTEQHR